MKAPRFSPGMLSAQLHVNLWQDLTMVLFGTRHVNSVPSYLHDTGYFQYENDAEEEVWRRIAPYVYRKAGWELVLPLRFSSGESQEFELSITDRHGVWVPLTPYNITTEDDISLHWYDLSAVTLGDIGYFVKVDTPDEHFPEVLSVYEYPTYFSPLPLLDFVVGDHPTVDEWNDVSDEIDRLYEMIVPNKAFLAITNKGSAHWRYQNRHYSPELLWTINIDWPYYNNDFVEPSNNALTSAGIDVLLNGQRIGHTGVCILAHQLGNPTSPYDIEVLHHSGFRAGDKLLAEGTEVTIGSVDGNVFRGCTWTGDLIQQQYDRLWGSYVPTPGFVSPPPTGFEVEQWQEIVNITSAGLATGDSYSLEVVTDQHVHSGSGEIEVTVAEFTEWQSITQGVAWRPMKHWGHGDPVPGTADKALNNVIENLRSLQAYRLLNFGGERLRAVQTQVTMSHLNIRNQWRMLAYIAFRDVQPQLHYMQNDEWITLELETTEGEWTWQFLDLRKTLPFLNVYQFYTVTNVDWAMEIPNYG